MSIDAILYLRPERVERKRKRDAEVSSFHIVIDLTTDEPVKEFDWKAKRAKWWELDVCYIQPTRSVPASRLVGVELNPGPTCVMDGCNNLSHGPCPFCLSCLYEARKLLREKAEQRQKRELELAMERDSVREADRVVADSIRAAAMSDAERRKNNA
jgi:hypothetical protein